MRAARPVRDVTDERPRDEALQTMLLALCLEPGAEHEFRLDPAAFARRFAVDERDALALATDGKRLPLYRRLVRGALGGTVRDVLGAFVARLDADAPGAFAASLDAFLAAGPPASLLRDVPRAFFTASRDALAADARVAPWIVEAGDAILTEHEVGAAPDAGARAASTAGTPDTELALDRGLHFAPALALRRYTFAVPDLDLDDLVHISQPPAERPAPWLLTRDRDDATSWRELTPAAATFLTRALAGDTLATSMAASLAAAVAAVAARTAGAADPAALQTELTELLAALAADGVLRGGR